MKSAKINHSQMVGGGSMELPAKPPISIFKVIWIALAFTFVAWVYGYPLFHEIVAPLLTLVGVL